MPLISLIVLAVVQGITEFLPVSSSGHLVLVWEAFDYLGLTGLWQSSGERLDLDVAVHVGTLAAVCLYFHRDLRLMLVGLLRLALGRMDEGTRLAWLIVVGTVPVVVVGFLARDWIAANLHGVAVVAWANIVFACLLWFADRYGLLLRRVQHMRVVEALAVGLAQVLALVPGTSRAGITMTVARLLGYEREEAARFSMLLAIPAIAGAGLLIGLDLYQREALQLGREALVAAVISMLTALVALALMMRWLRRASFQPFVFYRLALGALLLWLVYA